MGEPGTKEILSLEDLQVSGGIRTGRKHVLSILVENKPGVLARIAGTPQSRLVELLPWEWKQLNQPTAPT